MRKLSTLWVGVLLAVMCLYGCGGNTTNTDTPNLDELGAIELRFNADGTQPRFSDGTNYRVFVFIPGTTTQLVSPVFFNRDFTTNVQLVTLNAVPSGTVDLVLEALDDNGNVVGQARASNVLVTTNQTTIVDSSDLVGFGVSAGIDFTGQTDNTANEVITVQVSSGTTPTYTWNGASARDVSVVRVNDPNDPANITVVWAVSTLDTDGLSSPVIHGTVPTGATLAVNAEPVLTSGQTYRVSVVRLNGEFGQTTFIP